MLWVLGLALASLMTAGAPPADRVAASAGQRLADRYCGVCHAVTGREPGPLAEAPPFADLFRNTTEQRIEQLLASGMLAPLSPQDEGGPRRHPGCRLSSWIPIRSPT